MFWVIEQNLHREQFYDTLLSFLARVDIPYQLVKSVPFTGDLIPEPEPTQEHVIVIGSYSMALRAKARGWIPGAFVNDNYDYRVWSVAYDGHCLNAPATVFPFGKVPEQHGDFFIRPCADTKAFTGTVMSWAEYAEWLPKVAEVTEPGGFQDLRLDTMILIAEPRKIQAEYRFICVDGLVVTGSLYKSGSTVLHQECTSDSEAFKFAQAMVDIWTPDRAFALDVAMADGRYYVLEMGCMNAAGLYRCDVQKIVIAVEKMAFTL